MSHTILSSTHVPMAAEVLSWLFYKYTFSSCEAERIRRRRVADSLGVVINTGQGRGRVGKCLHARAGNTTASRVEYSGQVCRVETILAPLVSK